MRWTDEAVRWLTEIRDYIADDNRAAARRVVRGIYERAESLARLPNRGFPLEIGGREVRVVLWGHYRIVYVVMKDGDVEILGVYHGSLDLERHLR